MSGPSLRYRTSEAAYDGKLVFTHNLGGRIVAANSTQKFGFSAPCDCKILELGFQIQTAWTHASAALALGSEASAATLLASTDIHSVVAGLLDKTSALTAAALTISKGDTIVLSATSGDTTGILFPYLILAPR